MLAKDPTTEMKLLLCVPSGKLASCSNERKIDDMQNKKKVPYTSIKPRSSCTATEYYTELFILVDFKCLIVLPA